MLTLIAGTKHKTWFITLTIPKSHTLSASRFFRSGSPLLGAASWADKKTVPKLPLAFRVFLSQFLSTPKKTWEKTNSRNVEHGLELLDKCPFLHRDFGPVELLECVDTCTRDVRVQNVLLFKVTAVHGLVGSFDLHCHRGLTSLGDFDRLVVTFNRHPVASN